MYIYKYIYSIRFVCLYTSIYIYILYMYIRGGGGARAGTNPLWSNHTATLPPSPPKKGGKTRSMQKTVFLESACTTTAANNSAWWSSSEHGWFRPCSEELHYAIFFCGSCGARGFQKHDVLCLSCFSPFFGGGVVVCSVAVWLLHKGLVPALFWRTPLCQIFCGTCGAVGVQKHSCLHHSCFFSFFLGGDININIYKGWEGGKGWFRPCSEELHYAIFFVAVVVHAESTNTMFCVYLVFFFLGGGSM